MKLIILLEKIKADTSYVMPDEKGDIKVETTINENGELGLQAVQTRVEKDEKDGKEEIIETKVEIDSEGKVEVVETKIGEEGIKVATVKERENEVEVEVVEKKIEVEEDEEEVNIEETVFHTRIPKATDESDEAFKLRVYEEVINHFFPSFLLPFTLSFVLLFNNESMKVKREAETRSQSNQRTLILGEQPTWAGVEPCEPQPSSFLPSLLSEGISSISSRGYYYHCYCSSLFLFVYFYYYY